MVDDKIAHIEASGADAVLGGDLGCLLNIAGRIKRRGLPLRVLHTAEVLAGMGAGPSIGEPRER
jgi:L-lactate dehydrogenase complex protein LldE